MHGIVDREARRDRAAGRMDIELDVALRVLVVEEEKLCYYRVSDLVVNRRPGVPWVQVLSIYTFDEKGTRQITDYWCDVCSIPMYEIKDCECCQGPVELRRRKVD